VENDLQKAEALLHEKEAEWNAEKVQLQNKILDLESVKEQVTILDGNAFFSRCSILLMLLS
jgi:hypothetical protein